MRIMLDLETLSTKPNAAIISIGAVDLDDAKNLFYCVVDAESCVAVGLQKDQDTID